MIRINCFDFMIETRRVRMLFSQIFRINYLIVLTAGYVSFYHSIFIYCSQMRLSILLGSLWFCVYKLCQVLKMSSHDGSTPSSDPSTAQSSQPSISMSSGSRGRTDLVWGHCREAPELGVGCKKTKLVCLYCAKVFAGGDINQFKQHLAGAKGEVE
jgi:hypothetical protein